MGYFEELRPLVGHRSLPMVCAAMLIVDSENRRSSFSSLVELSS